MWNICNICDGAYSCTMSDPRDGEMVVVSIQRRDGERTVEWAKYGCKLLPNYWSVEVSHYDTDGHCYMRYNPTVRLHPSGGRYVRNYDWILEATDENLRAILAEVERMYRDDEKVKHAV